MAELVYEWDEQKRDANLAKHGFDFHAVRGFDWARAHVEPDDRRSYGEQRLRAISLLDGKLCVIIFALRGDVYRIISLRRANARERKLYVTPPQEAGDPRR